MNFVEKQKIKNLLVDMRKAIEINDSVTLNKIQYGLNELVRENKTEHYDIDHAECTKTFGIYSDYIKKLKVIILVLIQRPL
jgi:hypothetical protein